MAASSNSKSDPNAQIKLVSAIVVLFLAIGWLAYYFGAFDSLIRPRGEAVVSGATPEERQQKTDEIIKETNASSENAGIPKGGS
jgi:hypothetical protein